MVIPENVRNLLAQSPSMPVLLMGNPAFFDYELIPLDDGKDGSDWRPHSNRPSECLGALGIVDGVGRSALAVPALDEQALRFIAGMYAEHVRLRTAAQEPEAQSESSDDAWLARYYSRLYALPKA